MARLKERYEAEIRPMLVKEFGYGNTLEVPRLRKISVNMGIGKARENPKHLEDAMRDLSTITGQKAVVTKARKSIAQFHLREGYPVGCRVTLRGRRMLQPWQLGWSPHPSMNSRYLGDAHSCRKGVSPMLPKSPKALRSSDGQQQT